MNRNKIFSFILAFSLLTGSSVAGNAPNIEKQDSICTHPIVWGNHDQILSWYKPEIKGAGYDHVIKLASEFIRDEVPVDPKTGLKLYYLYCELNGPESGARSYNGIGGSNNPACVFAGLTESLAVKYRIYSGDESYLQVVRECLDHMLQHGSSPSDWKWGNCPYSSSTNGDPNYSGCPDFGQGGGDGQYFLEPDKVGEMGVAYLQFYQITEEPVYLKAALDCADALAANVRDGNYSKSPWPYRVHARTGAISEEYCSNVLPPVRLFDELARIQTQAKLSDEAVTKYKKARDMAWKWLFSWEGPMKTSVWKGYFEDVEYDHANRNRVQVTPMEVARYLIQYPECDPYYEQNVPALIHWCNTVFGTHNALGYNAQCEQLFCMTPMGSHTARYASVCAMWYALGKSEWYKTEAFENFNWATYCTSKSGFVSVGPDWMHAWFSDGYSDYIKHFLDGMAAIPQWAPAGENHLLGYTSVVQKINYGIDLIAYRTFLPESTETLRLTKLPKEITVDGKQLKRVDNLTSGEGWKWEKLKEGGLLRIKHLAGREITINTK
ncbi:MAG: hypothetical protein PHI28_17680 [Mangrovibacterium sp.]|nr:hypothetical protein [Mangrovibacterium sp.]